MESSAEADLAAVNRIAAVPRILDAMIDITGMRFAAVARVTGERWTACAVRDDLGFGLKPGDDLVLETTLCNEVRQHQQPVIFSHASEHPVFSQHHTPRQYGLESYVSVPILQGNGAFFGTLCAIDSRPVALEEASVLKAVTLFAELIGYQLEIAQSLSDSRHELEVAHERERAIGNAERDIRDMFQPIVTGLYLLDASPAISPDDRGLVNEMKDCCERIGALLRDRLKRAYMRVEGAAAQRDDVHPMG